VSLATELLKEFEVDIQSITLYPSDGGRYEIVVNDQLIYSKLETKRHAEPGEVTGLVRSLIREGL
jgi:selenoprotein W-related protein